MARPEYPETRREAIVETIHGVEVADPYRWLESVEDTEVQAWVDAQNGYSRGVLDALPGRAALEQRIARLSDVGLLSIPVTRGDRVFFLRRGAGEAQARLFMVDHEQEQVLIDPNTMDAEGLRSLDWFSVHPDGSRLAYGIAADGDEFSDLHVLDISSGQELIEPIPRCRWSSVAWLPDGSGFYYTRYPLPGEVPKDQLQFSQKVLLHRISKPWADDEVIHGPGDDPKEIFGIDLSEDGRWLLLNVFHGWTRQSIRLRDLQGDGSFLTLTEDVEAVFTGTLHRDQLWVLTNHQADKRRVMRADLSAPLMADWIEVVPEGEATIENAWPVGDRLLLTEILQVQGRLRLLDLSGREIAIPELPGIGSVMPGTCAPGDDHIEVHFSGFTTPATHLRIELADGAIAKTRGLVSPVDPARFTTDQVWFTSKDGTRIPMFILGARDRPPGPVPTLVTGYGGFNISFTPFFNHQMSLAWLELGGVFAIPNLRGGGEFGEAWHRAGMLGEKQNVFDDFHAACEYLINEGITTADQLVAKGGSNGGLLMGALLTQRPDLVKAIICAVPLLDMLRYHKSRLGALWTSEYGDPDMAEEFPWLQAYSPYHHIEDGQDYPATLFLTALADSRVDPMHAMKMAALVQHASSGDAPILLWVEGRAGHGIGKPAAMQIRESVDHMSFAAAQVGLDIPPLDQG